MAPLAFRPTLLAITRAKPRVLCAAKGPLQALQRLSGDGFIAGLGDCARFSFILQTLNPLVFSGGDTAPLRAALIPCAR
jgi:hypothetical protein